MLSEIQSAMIAYNQDNYIQYEDMHMAETRNAEDMLIEKDLFEKLLSDKAKQTVYIIFREPEEMTTKIRCREISWTQVKRHLHEQYGMTTTDLKRIRKEITKWLKS